MRYVLTDRRQDRHRDRDSAHKPFCGVDGEGGNFPHGHEYLLLRAGEHLLHTGKPLTWEECLPFLADLPKDRTYVAYFFDYDVTMMIRGLPPNKLTRLLDIDCRRIPGKPCSSFPIDFDGYQLDYLPGKEFRVRRRGRGNKWTVINDVGSFFQSSFVDALNKWFPEPEMQPVIDKIAVGKAQRNEFTEIVSDEEIQYNILEVQMTAKLMERFRDMCTTLGINPRVWQGPGNLVSSVFRRAGLPLNRDLEIFDTQPDFVKAANAAYYGGRFEVAQFGDVKGPVYQYDINSAYATTYKLLPCLIHGQWKRITSLPRTGVYLAKVRFKHDPLSTWGTLPVRTKSGSIIFPHEGNGIYWSTELDVARKHGVKLWIDYGWQYTGSCECNQFGFVNELYRKRQELGSNGQGMVLKIVLASMYGKLAQSVGCAPYSNPVWAGLITSRVRAQLIDAALSHNQGRDVVMLATDGLFSLAPLPELPISKRLGDWTLDVHDSIFTVQSGVYFLPGKPAKTRGVNKARLAQHEPQFRDAWLQYLTTGHLRSVPIELTSFIGLRLALARGKPETAGQWPTIVKEIGFDWATKRVLYNNPRNGQKIMTNPIPGSCNLHSQEYDRIIGGIRAAARLDLEDQPDWVTPL